MKHITLFLVAMVFGMILTSMGSNMIVNCLFGILLGLTWENIWQAFHHKKENDK